MSVPTTDTRKPTPLFFNVPATAAPKTLFTELERCGSGREQAAINELYPKLRPISPADRRRIADLGEIRIPQEYIVVGELDKDYSFLKVGQRFVLTKDAFSIPVDVVKNRRCGQAARALILLRAVASDSLELLADVVGELNVTDGQIGSNILGTVLTGKSNAQGSGQGYPNAYGHSRPVLPTEFLPLFTSLDPTPVPVSPPSAPPNQKHYTLLEWLLLTFYQFIAWLLAAFGSSKPANSPAKQAAAVKVAILDTGLNGAGAAPESGTCGAVHTGWNFVDDTPDVSDDHISNHGTRIAAIIQQQAPSVVCLPVKTANKIGVCELYDVLCGLEYARVNGARVVNASFSFSSNAGPGEAIPLLNNLISVLEKADIWVIAAAGNAIQYVHTAAGATPPLGQNAPFLYPACYSKAGNQTDAGDQIITVTTVSKTQQAGSAPLFGLGECYSPAFVDVGMIANSQPPTALFMDDKSFKAPGFSPEPGTSYATAYMTGRVANALATQTFAGKTQLVTAIGPELKPTLATGIHEGQSVPA